VYLLVLSATNTALNETGQFGGGLHWLSLLSIFNYASSDLSRVSLFTKLKNDSGDFRFG